MRVGRIGQFESRVDNWRNNTCIKQRPDLRFKLVRDARFGQITLGPQVLTR